MSDMYLDREARRKELQCILHPLGTLKDYKYVVVCTFLGDRIVLSKHKQRDTWEFQGGHIEPGESPLDAAKRELYEESGITDAQLLPLCDYYGYNSRSHANGVIFVAQVEQLRELPPFEMKEIGVFSQLPEQLTYPYVTPIYFAEARKLGPCDGHPS